MSNQVMDELIAIFKEDGVRKAYYLMGSDKIPVAKLYHYMINRQFAKAFKNCNDKEKLAAMFNVDVRTIERWIRALYNKH